MVENQKQMRYSQEELSLFKNTFAEDERLLKVLINFLLGNNLTEQEEVSLIKISTESVLELIEKTLLPDIDEKDTPIGQVASLWFQTANETRDKTPEQAMPHFMARDKMIKYIRESIEHLKNKTPRTIILKDLTNINDKSELDAYVDIMTFNSTINFIQTMVAQIKHLAGKKDETPEETAKRLLQNSSK